MGAFTSIPNHWCRETLPGGMTCTKLVDLTINFFNQEPKVQDKLERYKRDRRCSGGRSRSRSSSPEGSRTKKRVSKADSLKPISQNLIKLFQSNELDRNLAEKISEDIIERLVIAGYGWDKVLHYHSKVYLVFRKKELTFTFISRVKINFVRNLYHMCSCQKTIFQGIWIPKMYSLICLNSLRIGRIGFMT